MSNAYNLNRGGSKDEGYLVLEMKVKIIDLFLKGSDWTMSLDGHDKLCGYQNATFPLCIYGGLDTYSGRIQFLKIWTTNSNPKIIGRHYLQYLLESRGWYCNPLIATSRIILDGLTRELKLWIWQLCTHIYLASTLV